MPKSAPTFKPRKQTVKLHQSAPRLSSCKRGYGRTWQKASKAYLSKHPLCVHCQHIDIVKPAKVVDHIKPHKGDMALFWNRKNWQSLCEHHHNSKTAREDGGFGRAVSA